MMSLIRRFKIEDLSMEPTLSPDDYVLVSGFPYLFRNPKTGDVIVFRLGGKNLIKRIRDVSQRGYFVIGDNKENSMDSKKFGLIKKEQIIGKVILKVR